MNRLRNSFIVVKMNAAIFHVVPREESTPLILLVRPAPLLCPRQKSNLDPRFRPAPSLCPQEELNLCLKLRRLALYPLSYGGRGLVWGIRCLSAVALAKAETTRAQK